MATMFEAVYEHGVLKPFGDQQLKEQQHYRITVEEISKADVLIDPGIAAEIERRTTVLPDGRRVISLLGLFDRGDPGPTFEEIEATLDGFRVLTPMVPTVPELAREIERLCEEAGLSLDDLLQTLREHREHAITDLP